MLNRFILTAFLFAQVVLGHGQTFEWVRPYANEQCGKPKNYDGSGNKYSLTTLPAYGDTLFLRKTDPNNNVLWTVRQSILHHGPYLEVDSEGNCYVAGSTDYYNDLVIARYSPSGTRLWEKKAERNHQQSTVYINAMGLDLQGNVFVLATFTGIFQMESLNFKANPMVIARHLPDEVYNKEVVLIKYGSNGTPLWCKMGQGPEHETGSALTTDSEGNVYIAGQYDKNITFDNSKLFYSWEGFKNCFIAKFNPAGELKWTSRAYGNNLLFQGICIDDSGNVLLSGTGTGYFGGLEYHQSFPFYANLSPHVSPRSMYRINCGGQEIPDSPMNWASDRQVNPSPFLDALSSNHTTGTFTEWNGTNTTGAPKDIFGTNRYDIHTEGDLIYHFPVPQGSYTVNLYFAEKPSLPELGQRIFDVFVEENLALENYDIVEAVGMAADKRSFIVSVNDGWLDLRFVGKTGYAQVNGIEILAQDGGDVVTAVDRQESVASVYVVNPVADKVAIFLKQASAVPEEVCIYNSQGVIVYQGTHMFDNGSFVLNTSSFIVPPANGIYFVKVGSLNAVKFYKE